MLHNNIFWTIEEMWSKVDIEDEKKQHNAFEKALGFHTLMPLDDNTMVVHIGSNLMISKYKKSGMQLGQDQTPLNDYNHRT